MASCKQIVHDFGVVVSLLIFAACWNLWFLLSVEIERNADFFLAYGTETDGNFSNFGFFHEQSLLLFWRQQMDKLSFNNLRTFPIVFNNWFEILHSRYL